MMSEPISGSVTGSCLYIFHRDASRFTQGALKEIHERLGHSTIQLTLDRSEHRLSILDEGLRKGLDARWPAVGAGETTEQPK